MKENYVNAGYMAKKAANSPMHKPLLEEIQEFPFSMYITR